MLGFRSNLRSGKSHKHLNLWFEPCLQPWEACWHSTEHTAGRRQAALVTFNLKPFIEWMQEMTFIVYSLYIYNQSKSQDCAHHLDAESLIWANTRVQCCLAITVKGEKGKHLKPCVVIIYKFGGSSLNFRKPNKVQRKVTRADLGKCLPCPWSRGLVIGARGQKAASTSPRAAGWGWPVR